MRNFRPGHSLNRPGPVASGCDKPGGLLHPAIALATGAGCPLAAVLDPSDLPRVRFSGGRNTTAQAAFANSRRARHRFARRSM